MKWVMAGVALMCAMLGAITAALGVFAAIGLIGLLFTTPLHNDGGVRGTVHGESVVMPVGPDALFGTVRVYACNPLSSDGQCSPTRQFDVHLGHSTVSLHGDDGTVDVDLGEPYDIWRGDYTRRAEVYERWTDVPEVIRSHGQAEPADGYQLKVLSIADGEAVHIYGEGPDRRIVVGDASSQAATDRRLRLLGNSKWGVFGVTAALALVTVLLWGFAVFLALRVRGSKT